MATIQIGTDTEVVEMTLMTRSHHLWQMIVDANKIGDRTEKIDGEQKKEILWIGHLKKNGE